ncbi:MULTISPECIES: Flp family type IVb pilin [unclassified Novosphingobium]|uniref:Flp family type IVb pilin n=1 Tax=unclassified Novosphingobium TaxID=2644732 RepID=UPI000B11DD86|nr:MULTISPECIES: Flp family type IVb pilin [unclassified Novosphingobium]
MIMKLLRRLIAEDRSGATAIEMGFLVALISVAMIASLHTFSNQLNNTFLISAKNLLVP